MTKSALRSLIRNRLKSVSPIPVAWSQSLVNHLAASPIFRDAQTIGLFAPLPSEPDLALLWPPGHRHFCYPRVNGDQLLFQKVLSLNDLHPATWNPLILEPLEHLETIPLPQIDLLLVPGLAFTPTGLRLGRGGGYYDRLLSMFPHPNRVVGVGFQIQICPEIPTETHDQSVASVLTESGFLTP